MSILTAAVAPALPAGTVWQVAPQPLANVGSDRQFRTISEAARAVQAGNTIFVDLSARDFRISANSPARKLQAYPRGEVPGTRLGIVRKIQPAD